MIISKKHKIFFMHIPKCAGTTVRKAIATIDETFDIIDKNKTKHLDLAHLPLFSLFEYYPMLSDILEKFDSFVIIRHPFERFSSSFSQRVLMYKQKTFKDLTEYEKKEEVNHVINYLNNKILENKLLPPEFIHFQKQYDYIYYNDKCMIKSIYKINEVDILLERLMTIIGVENMNYVSDKRNQTLVYKNDFTRKIKYLLNKSNIKKITRNIPKPYRQKLNNTFFYKPYQPDNESIFTSNFVKDFVSNYYYKDIQLYNDHCSQ